MSETSTSGDSTTGTSSSDSTADTDGPSDPLSPLDAHQYCDAGVAMSERMFSTDTVPSNNSAMAVGTGAFIDERDDTIVVATRDQGPVLELFQHDGISFVSVGSIDAQAFPPMDVGTGDLDGDDYDDVVVAFEAEGSAAIRVFWGSEDGLGLGDEEIELAPDTPFSLAIGDLEMGGNLEIVVAQGDQAAHATMVQVDDRALVNAGTAAGVSASPWDAITVDLEGDGIHEVLVAGSHDEPAVMSDGDDRVTLFRGSDGLVRDPDFNLPEFQSPYGVDAGDIDGDGRLDIVVVGKNIPADGVEESSDASELSICIQSDTGTFDCATALIDDQTGFNNVRLGDFDCDGVLDAFIGSSGGVEEGDGGVRVAWGPLSIESDIVQVGVTDFGSPGNRMVVDDVDGDGRPEVIVPFFAGGTRVFGVDEVDG